jgi:hypothetical protein
MLKHCPQIVHFCGHGEGDDGLVFESDRGLEQRLRTDALSDLFRLCASHVECVLLNACYSVTHHRQRSKFVHSPTINVENCRMHFAKGKASPIHSNIVVSMTDAKMIEISFR